MYEHSIVSSIVSMLSDLVSFPFIIRQSKAATSIYDIMFSAFHLACEMCYYFTCMFDILCDTLCSYLYVLERCGIKLPN